MLMNNLGQATEAMARVATQTANQQAQLTAALQRLVEDPRQGTRAPVATPGPASVPFDTGGKILKPPEAFSPAIEEEVSQWSDWAFTFKNFLAFMDQAFLTDLKSAEDQKVEISSDISNTFFGDDRERMNRGLKLYSVLSSYLKNRPLKVLRSVSGMNGFEVWRKLTAELEPSSRSRSLAMAQALVGFPAMSKGASLMDYVLTFEKLISEYEKISGTKYDDNLKIGTLLKGIPQNLKQHVMVDITDRATYDELRTKLLQYERSNQTWSAENILGSLSVPDPTTHTSSKPYQGPIPMELDRIYFRKGKGDQKGKGDKGKGGKGKGDRGKGKGYGGRKGGRGSKGKGRGFGRGFGKGKGKGKKGGKNVRQVEKATRAEKEKADKELFATIAVRPATLLLSVGRHQVEKEKEKVEKEKCGMFRKLEKKTGALIHKQAHQHSRKQEQHQQQKEMNKFDDWLPRLCLLLKKLMMMIM